ncbi:hypothetical protein AAG570_000187 [Ranatra chinensis]|uniref:Uncharacterized protein n=1 Tax=Ranatra chinensis TaxID=642074 RepID=A0ABD0YWC5_9HEMI
MPEVCFLTGRPETQCKRKRLLNTLKTMVTHLEQDQKRECLVPKLVAKGDSCLCPGGRGRIPSFWLKETVCLDGKKAIPRKNDIVQPRKWVPACTSPRPMLDSSLELNGWSSKSSFASRRGTHCAGLMMVAVFNMPSFVGAPNDLNEFTEAVLQAGDHLEVVALIYDNLIALRMGAAARCGGSGAVILLQSRNMGRETPAS